ncbi:hypothetical protein PSJ68_08315 [Escherichia coli]|uniref:hypothetical protein n=1 Tax=Escherichia coli TaxID=562 RepID=UPI00235A1DDF|nr:hypothetical protein [Escherichia coli]MDC9107385.1 hypothetical protein [Escherichia coli]
MKNYSELLIIHEYGEPTHYQGIIEIAQERGIKVRFLEFSILHNIYAAIKKKNKCRYKGDQRLFDIDDILILSKNE